MSKKAVQYTIRNVPASVDRALRKRASTMNTSLNRLLVHELERAAGVMGEPPMHRDLDDLIGSWVEDPAVDQALAEQRRIGPGDWS